MELWNVRVQEQCCEVAYFFIIISWWSVFVRARVIWGLGRGRWGGVVGKRGASDITLRISLPTLSFLGSVDSPSPLLFTQTWDQCRLLLQNAVTHSLWGRRAPVWSCSQAWYTFQLLNPMTDCNSKLWELSSAYIMFQAISGYIASYSLYFLMWRKTSCSKDRLRTMMNYEVACVRNIGNSYHRGIQSASHSGVLEGRLLACYFYLDVNLSDHIFVLPALEIGKVRRKVNRF